MEQVGSQDGSKRSQDAPKMGPRGPKMLQDAPRWVQEAPKMALRGSQDGPRGPKRRAKNLKKTLVDGKRLGCCTLCSASATRGRVREGE